MVPPTISSQNDSFIPGHQEQQLARFTTDTNTFGFFPNLSTLDTIMDFNNGGFNLSVTGDTDMDLSYYPDFSQIPAVRRAFIIAYVVIIILTVLGNGLVVFVVVGQRKMHNSVNYLICNLAGKWHCTLPSRRQIF